MGRLNIEGNDFKIEGSLKMEGIWIAGSTVTQIEAIGFIN